MLGRYCLGALLTQTCEVFHMAGALNMLYISQTSVHACHFEYIGGPWHSKPHCPNPPACLRSVTWGLRSARVCTASTSWCWVTGWNARQKLNLCFLDYDYRSRFYCPIGHDIVHAFWWMCNNENGSTRNCCACTWVKTARQTTSHKVSNTQSNINVTL